MAKSSREKKGSGRSKGPARSSAWAAIKRTFSHRRLIAVEALLLVGLLDRLGRQWVIHEAPAPEWLKVIILMALVVGVLGGVLLLLQKGLTSSLSKTHDVVKALPLPTPLVFVHAAAFVGLFFLYAWATGLSPWIKVT